MAAFEAERAAKRLQEDAPVKPVARSLTIGKATVEGVQHMLRGQSHIGLFTGEGGELLGGQSMQQDRGRLAWRGS